jgi:hypothetical protein
LAISSAQAGGTLKIDDTRSVTVGAGLRTSFNSVENAAPNGTDSSKEFELDSIRLYLSGQVTKEAKLVFNTERNTDGTVRVLDGIAQFAFSDTMNLWAGRFLPPSDRSNLSGPYYLATWDFPFVQNYPAIFAGRDDGMALWGQTGGGKFKYQIGAFQGRDGTGTSNQSDSLLYAGRLTFNFWAPEPGYYNDSTYYGAKDILAVGLVAQSQSDGAGTSSAPGDFTGLSVDALMEKKLGANVLSVEGAYYDYDLSNVTDASLIQGNGYFAQVSFLIGAKVGPGMFQPHVRYQSFDATGSANEHTRYDLGVNYVIDGHNARITAIYANDDTGTASTNIFRLGVQLQI